SVRFLEPRGASGQREQAPSGDVFGGGESSGSGWGAGAASTSSQSSNSNKGFDADPFSGGGKIDLSDDDLPF
ncbi:MAG: single-stranded DNA-binding protein, partial [Exiguobacterium sp.]|nr:single-stranded DNA-binding protein [Exiguobacterium sp.]